MKIVVDRPPMFDEINKAFNIINTKVIFAWGDIIYNPSNFDIPPELIAHEEVHGKRQGDDIEGWWQNYLQSPSFRLEEEIPAHQAEYQWMCKNGNRGHRRKALKFVASRLAAPLYGRMTTPSNAKRLILKG